MQGLKENKEQDLERDQRHNERTKHKLLPEVQRQSHGVRYSDEQITLWLNARRLYKKLYRGKKYHEAMEKEAREIKTIVPSDATFRRWEKKSEDELDPNPPRDTPPRIDKRLEARHKEAELMVITGVSLLSITLVPNEIYSAIIIV